MPTMAAGSDEDLVLGPTADSQPSTRTCPQCGGGVSLEYLFCNRCGEALRGPAPSDPAERPLAAAARLVVQHGDGTEGTAFGLAAGETLLGRNEGQILFPDDPLLSPVHARLYFRDGRLYVTDADSANGVYRRVTTPEVLEHGDVLIAGEQHLRVDRVRPPGEEPEADGSYFLGCHVYDGDFRLTQMLVGGREGRAYSAKTSAVTMGREGCDLNFPDDRFMSRRHAKVSSEDGAMRLTDLGSRNGTSLRIRGERILQHGDHLLVGEQLLRVDLS